MDVTGSMMRIVSGSEVFNNNFQRSVVTIGNFDGVHLGHKGLFHRLKEYSSARNLTSVVVTFEPHPLKVLAPDTAPCRITTYEQKLVLIAETGVDALVVIPFSLEIARMSAESFVREILCHSLGMTHIIIGHDYAFGRGRQGNFETLQRLGTELNFTLEDIDPIGTGDLIYSSSLARNRISDGDMQAVSGILGRYYMISGTVVHGRDIGHALGFPTANISSANEIIPPDGVYAVMVSLGGRHVQGACNIGFNPTFEGRERTIEVFLLDFSGQIYGQEISVYFVHRLRDVKKFDSVAELKDTISQDVEATRQILGSVRKEFIRPVMTGNP
jgi:riboflavin kinase/FMN adenylyltransferase